VQLWLEAMEDGEEAVGQDGLRGPLLAALWAGELVAGGSVGWLGGWVGDWLLLSSFIEQGGVE